MGWNDYLDDPDSWEDYVDRLRQQGDTLRKEQIESPKSSEE